MAEIRAEGVSLVGSQADTGDTPARDCAGPIND